ncbi:DNA-binding transcriptional response regulator, NtrC family, contains REC, AAA-type ATPase, and a Fis-type DNA-binding domains [Ferrimonas sediminum]|uniref:DNA-binding transcriptional response regulator, NtrC family, contains REC, AAA-type ATPase, and a Fis-type DNA-binding domains n=1 Tax=Ferrimonas sediminum TaxID=718193 RepID=A0A1G8PTN8_9GAMM|nr:sigma-54 dependent transcriptional regulator [Ferrimonas sediminum]SDI95841.1 DNA-binding transcriptional response regulator, NtrC family, contains REC, AAA-type ATPase, and a Fis-type DNA-binding domains [Ferrimonas sediminum]
MASRKLICLLDPKQWTLPDSLIQAGWRPCYLDSLDQARALINPQKPCVGIVLFDERWVNGLNQALEVLLQESAGCIEWVGLVNGERGQNDPACRLIARYCCDYHTLPVEPLRLAASLGHVDGMARLRRRSFLEEEVSPTEGTIVGESAAMRNVYRQIRKVALTDATVLLEGESGTGKELVAQAIHRGSLRSEGPFIAVNCGAIPINLIQSELFGHERGSFTGAHSRHKGHIETASGGTIFLDEIGDLHLEVQVNLLRFLQEKVITRVGGVKQIPVDVRVIAATNKNLIEEVQAERFREDLYYRLCILNLKLPPLRERREDIELLAHYYFRKYRSMATSKVQGFTPKAMKQMLAYDWPGNIRELKNRVQRALVMCEQRTLGPRDLNLEMHVGSQEVATLADARAETDLRVLLAALNSNGNNIMKTAKALGISRVTLYRMLDKYNVSVRPDSAQK